MIKKIIFGVPFLLSKNCFANSTASDSSEKDAAKTNDVTKQKIIHDFSAYASTMKPEVREEIQKYRVAIVKIIRRNVNYITAFPKRLKMF